MSNQHTYLEEFKGRDDIVKQFEIKPEELDGADILLAWYGYGSYSGEALVIFKRDDSLYEVNGSH